MKALRIGSNKAGTRHALVRDGAGFSVFVECHNNAPHCRGGIAVTWRWVERKLSLEDAEALFARRLKGKIRR